MDMRTVVCGIGNPCRKDDAAGLEAAKLLCDRFSVVLCDTVPERFVEEIRLQEPERIIILDAIDIGATAGSWKRIAVEHIDSSTLSTHSIPLSLFHHLLADFCRHIDIYGIQIQDTQFGTGLTEDVRAGVRSLVSWLDQKYSASL
jgi:hydrogenase maturation protease